MNDSSESDCPFPISNKNRRTWNKILADKLQILSKPETGSNENNLQLKVSEILNTDVRVGTLTVRGINVINNQKNVETLFQDYKLYIMGISEMII